MSISHRLSVMILAAMALISTAARSQALFAISADEKVSHSGLIVEGKVIGKRSYWNAKHTMIYTSNEVEVYKIFKGSLEKSTIEVVTTGGVVDNYAIVASDLLQLDNDDVGIFYCQPNRPETLISKENTYNVYSSSQGFLKYDLSAQTAAAPFAHYGDIENQLYKELYKKTGKAPQIRNSAFSIKSFNKSITPGNGMDATLAPPVTITSFSPSTVTGGTIEDPANNVLTINGSGFGDHPNHSAAVGFTSADKGDIYDIPSDSLLILSWKDNQIKMMVPTVAGTGTFRIRTNAGITASSPTALQVFYTVLSANVGHRIVQYNLVNQNGTGGYTVKYSNSTANHGQDITGSSVKATVQRALNTWKDLTGVNIAEAGATSNQAINTSDGENIIAFDNSATTLDGPLPDGVLATCYSGLGFCGDTSRLYFKTGFDILIRNAGYSAGNINFTFGPCSPYSSATQQVDLETVLLHEMGHALNLGHVIDMPEGSGAGRQNPAKLMNFSINYNLRRISPDYSAMTGAAYLVNPHGYTYGSCLPANPEMVPLKVNIDPRDGCPTSFPTAATPTLTSVFFDLAHCTSNKFEDPAYDQMSTDGTGTGITNTAFYPFRTNSDGGDVSFEINEYATSPAELAACVPASSIPVTGVQMSVYEASSCPGGQSFPTPVFYTVFSANGNLPPVAGLKGNTNYLVVLDGVENTKASFNMVFSGSALPKPSTDFQVHAYPNPVNGQSVSIQIFNQKAGSYTLVMYNVLGQIVLQKPIAISSSSHLEVLPVSSLAKGIYHLSLVDPDKKKIQAITIAITK